ncbi:MAG: 50S ribosomal protein L13 [Saprospiraceae bacterium]|nr:50S ribosomal protein L13 [Saprospiraceae bacterium]
MNTLSFKTSYSKSAETSRKWHVVDAEGQVVGRLSSQVAHLLMGKHKTDFAPHMDCGDNVIIVNAAKVRFTGKKMDDKVYLTYSGYPGGQKSATPREVLAKHPNRILEVAIRKMLPKSKLGDAMYRKLFIYEGAEHPHSAQKPEPYTI